MSKNKNKKKGRGIGFLMVLFTILIVGGPLYIQNYLNQKALKADMEVTADYHNYSVSTKTAAAADKEINTVCSNSLFLINLLNTSSSQIFVKDTVSLFFESNPNIAAIAISNGKQYINEEYFSANDLDNSTLEYFLSSYETEIQEADSGISSIVNASPIFTHPVIAIMIPWKNGGKKQTVIVFYSTEELTQVFAAGSTNLSYMVNHKGELLIHPDMELIRAGANFTKRPLVEQMRKSKETTDKVTYSVNEKEYFGAFTKLSFADTAVLSELEKTQVTEVLVLQAEQNKWFLLAAVAISVVIMFIFAIVIKRIISKLSNQGEDFDKGENMASNS